MGLDPYQRRPSRPVRQPDHRTSAPTWPPWCSQTTSPKAWHPAFGSAQTASDGGLSVGWGEAPSISEFSPSGKLMFNAVFNGGSFTYRACLLPCNPAV